MKYETCGSFAMDVALKSLQRTGKVGVFASGWLFLPLSPSPGERLQWIQEQIIRLSQMRSELKNVDKVKR